MAFVLEVIVKVVAFGLAVTILLGLVLMVPLNIVCRIVRCPLHKEGTCGACGYDLAGLATGAACPECGLISERNMPRVMTWHRFSIERRRGGFKAFAIVILGGGTVMLADFAALLCAYMPFFGSEGVRYAQRDADLWTLGGMLASASVCASPTALIMRISGRPGPRVLRLLVSIQVILAIAVGVAVWSAALSSRGPWAWHQNFELIALSVCLIAGLMLLLLGPERPVTPMKQVELPARAE